MTEKLYTEVQLHRLTHVAAINAQFMAAISALNITGSFVGNLSAYVEPNVGNQADLDLLDARIRAAKRMLIAAQDQLNRITQSTLAVPYTAVEEIQRLLDTPVAPQEREAPPNT